MAALFLFSTFAQMLLMKPVLLSTAYLPPISWMAVSIQSLSIDIEVQETYPKQTFRNRCKIYTSAGVLSLTVPVKMTNGNHTKTADIGIDNSKNWQQHHWRSIITAYNKSPYFLYYRDLLEPIFSKKHERLLDLNHQILSGIIKGLLVNQLNIRTTHQYDFMPNGYDFRNSFHPALATPQGIHIELPRYMQVFESIHGYIPDLSIIDLLFNLGPDTLQYLAAVKLSIQDGSVCRRIFDPDVVDAK